MICKTDQEQALWEAEFARARAAGKLWYEAVNAGDARLRAHREAQAQDTENS